MLLLRHSPKTPAAATPASPPAPEAIPAASVSSPSTPASPPTVEPRPRRRQRSTPARPDQPAPPSRASGGAVVHLPAVVRDLLTHTATATSRYAVRDVLVERRAGQLNLVATDGHRLAWIRQPVDERDLGRDVSLLLPADTLRTLRLSRTHPCTLRLSDEPDGRTWLLAAADQLVRVTPEAHNFPAYREVIPPEAPAAESTKPAEGRATQPRSARDVPGLPAHVWVNPAYLADAATLAQRFTQHAADGVRSVRWQQPNRANRPIRLDAQAGDAKLTVVVMPTSGPR